MLNPINNYIVPNIPGTRVIPILPDSPKSFSDYVKAEKQKIRTVKPVQKTSHSTARNFSQSGHQLDTFI